MNARSERNCRLIESTHLLEIDFDMHSQDSVAQNCFTASFHLFADSVLRMRRCLAGNRPVPLVLSCVFFRLVNILVSCVYFG